MKNVFDLIFKRKKYIPQISNIIQFDEWDQGYRLIINQYGKQEWVASRKAEGDVILKWMDYNLIEGSNK